MIQRFLAHISFLVACVWFGQNWLKTGDDRLTVIAGSIYFMLFAIYCRLSSIDESKQ